VSLFTTFNGFLSGGFFANAVNFNGTDTHLSNTDITGASDTKFITLSFWIKGQSIAANETILRFADASVGFVFDIRPVGSLGSLDIRAQTSGADVLTFRAVTGVLTEENWTNVLMSVDLSDTGKRDIYLNGSVDSPSYTTYNDNNIGWSLTDELGIGAGFVGSGFMGMDMSEFYLNVGEFIDLSVQANREKFILNGKPVSLGADGSLPTGTAPDIFLTGQTGLWHTNKATGGGFTENGALTTATTSPSD